MSLDFNAGGDSELSATLHNRRAQIIDNIFDGTAFLNAMKTYGGVEVDSMGGVGIVRALQFQRQSSTASFAGSEAFTVPSEHDDHTSGNWPWASLWAHLTIPWDEETRNSGAAQLINIVNMKIDAAEVSLRDFLNEQLMQAQSSEARDMISLTEIIDIAPGGQPPRASVPNGGIDQSDSANAWVRNTFNDDNAAVTIARLRKIYNDASDGHDPPTFLCADQIAYEAYEDLQRAAMRFGSGGTQDAAPTHLLFKMTPIVWDPNIVLPSQTAVIYGINTKYHKLMFHVKGQFRTSNFIEHTDRAAKTAKILVMAQHFSTNRRRDFVLGCNNT